ncbi:homeobox protein 2 [Condylostylus longicornis]|uniref:homeobox protein 2 n=1 Tax=Condylostylus longicornis TaxID=2530218 RepID=UPI00244E2462|nr:homeobox protein 2 [Condylostylus longicornis]
MDCYTQLPPENRFGLSRYSRHSDTPSPLLSPPVNRIDSPNYLNKMNNETTNSFLNHPRNSSPIRYSQHQYPASYKMTSSTLLPAPAPTNPMNYYPYNFDSNYPRNYLPRSVSNFSPPTPVDQFKNSLDRINGCVNSSIPGPLEEYYRNTHYNYSQSFNNYGKLNVPKSSYYNHHLGLPTHRTSHIPAPSPTYYSTPRNEFYDPIAGLHQTVRNGFKDNIGLSNTYHNIYNYSPPLTTHLKRPHYPTPYNPHHPQALYPNSYSAFPSYNGKSTSFDYYRSHYTQLNSYPEYQTTNSAQYHHLYQQQQQHHQQLLQSKHNALQHSSLYQNSYPNPITLSNENLNHQVDLMHSPRSSEYNSRYKNFEENSENKLESLINEELRPLSSNLDHKNLSNNERKFSDSIEDLPLEINNSNRDDKIEQRAESSISESNTVNDMNSETTIASSPLTSVSSYTDSGISGCSNIIDGNNTSDGSIVEEKPDENNINQINSNNTEEDSNEIKLELIDTKMTNDHLNEADNLNIKKEDEIDPKPKAHNIPSSTSLKGFKAVNKKDNQLDRVIKPFSDNCSNEKNQIGRNNSDFSLHTQHKENYNKNSPNSSSKTKNTRNQRENNNSSRAALKNDSLQLENKKSNSNYWSSHHHYQFQSRSKSQRDDNTQKHNNNKNSNKNNSKTNVSTNINNRSRVLECDFIPSKKSRKKSGSGNCLSETVELREEIKDIKPLPAFQQAFGSTEIGRFSEIFQNSSPESSYNFNMSSYDYNLTENGSPYLWTETGESLEGSHHRNFYKNSLYSNYIENYDTIESSKENYYNSFD